MKQNKEKAKVIGLTGGIASGKSTVTNMLRTYGFPVVDADQIARDVVEIGQPAYGDILREFGKGILRGDLTINRQKLGEMIFGDKDLRLKLNQIVHPRVNAVMLQQVESYLKGASVVFVDIPLLFEVKDTLEREGFAFDEIWVVFTKKEQQIERLMHREGIDRQEAIKRITAQMPLEEKRDQADKVIDNTQDIKNLETSLGVLLRDLM